MEQSDPLWQLTLYVVLNPMFRLLHADKGNVYLWMLGMLAVFAQCLKMHYAALGIGVLALGLLAIKQYLTCGECTQYYLENRCYNASRLVVHDVQVPTLQLNGKTPFDNGFEHGILLAEEIIHLIHRFKKFVNPKIPAWVLKDVNNSLPDNIRSEIRGMYEAIDSIYMNELTYWDILMIQMIPEYGGLACTCYAAYDSEDAKKKVILGRNMDWMPFSSAQYSIIIEYKNHGYKSLGMPGMIGCVTAWKPNFALAMNVVGGNHHHDTRLLPSMLFNKSIMIQANTYEHACRLASEKHPMADFHLTLACAEDASCYSYSVDDTYVRKLSELKENLVTLNWSYPEHTNGRYISHYRDVRTKGLTDQGYDHVVEILQTCQTFETMHSLVFEFGESSDPNISIDNGFAADF